MSAWQLGSGLWDKFLAGGGKFFKNSKWESDRVYILFQMCYPKVGWKMNGFEGVKFRGKCCC